VITLRSTKKKEQGYTVRFDMLDGDEFDPEEQFKAGLIKLIEKIEKKEV
jgi:hypothetical protein